MNAPIIEAKRPGVYLLHFCQPLGDSSRPRCSASHYCGSAKSVSQRLAQHERNIGFGSIVHAANNAGIIWIVARIEYTDTVAEAVALERKWKRAGHHDRRCLICQEQRERNEQQMAFTF